MNFIWDCIKGKFKKRKVYELKRVFTPASVAEIAYIPRPQIEKVLSKAIDIIGKQVVIYGHSGSGKTTILTHVLNENKKTSITTRCTNESTMTTIILDAFEELNPYYIESRSKSDTSTVNATLSADYCRIKQQIGGTNTSNTGEMQKRVIPPQLTIQSLSRFVGESGAVWVIEDFHKVGSESKKSIAQMMKLIMDTSTQYPSCKIIVLGAADSGADVVEHDPELTNRVSEIEVPLLNDEEIQGILEKGSAALNINLSTTLISLVTNYSNGLATIAHQLAYNLCYNKKIYRTQRRPVDIREEELPQAIEDFTAERQGTYEEMYKRVTQQRAGTYKNVEIILKALCLLNKKEALQHELLQEIKKEHTEYPPGNLSMYLKKLTNIEGEEVLRNHAGRYSFSDPFFEAYVKMVFAISSDDIHQS